MLLQIDIQDYSLVQSVASCVVDGTGLLALGNEAGLQVSELHHKRPHSQSAVRAHQPAAPCLTTSMPCAGMLQPGTITTWTASHSACNTATACRLMAQVWDSQGNNLLYVWRLPRSEVPCTQHADFVRGISFNMAADGSVQLCAGCSNGTIQVRKNSQIIIVYAHKTAALPSASGSVSSAGAIQLTSDVGAGDTSCTSGYCAAGGDAGGDMRPVHHTDIATKLFLQATH